MGTPANRVQVLLDVQNLIGKETQKAVTDYRAASIAHTELEMDADEVRAKYAYMAAAQDLLARSDHALTDALRA